jgi:large subunit ribosomal protein L18e
MKTPEKTNQELKNLIRFLEKAAREKNAKIWKAVAKLLSKSSRKRIVVNISKINRHTKKGETIVVPGKVLAAGEIKHPVIIAAYAFSQTAKIKITKAKGKCLSISELVEKNPKGSNVKIIR